MTTIETHPDHAPPASLVDAIFELGAAWADVGLLQGKTALESTANALARTARALDALRVRITAEREPPPDVEVIDVGHVPPDRE